MTIEEKDLPLLIALQENPLAPASSLAEKIGVSTPTVITRLNLLKEQKSYYSVIADLKPETLGLKTVDLLIEINDIENVNFFEKTICYNHPFTLFRIRCMGQCNGLYVQFRIPIGSRTELFGLLEQLKKEDNIQDFTFIETLNNFQTIYTQANLANWESNLMRWEFDWKNWLEKLSQTSSKPLEYHPTPSVIEDLDKLDLALLEEMTMSARRKNTEIMDTLGLDKTTTGLPQKISRKMHFLQENVINRYRVFLRWETFEIYNSFLVNAKCNKTISGEIQNLLATDPIPFESIYKITEEGFLWYIRCPASHFSNISELLWTIGDRVNFYFLDYKKSEYYGLWTKPFNLDKHKWNTDFMSLEKLFGKS